MSYDLAVVGAGVLGLAHAWAAARRGKRVVVLERDGAALGASIRNFGFVTVTGQQAGDCWRMARRTREVWAEIAAAAEIPVLHEGVVVAARRPEAEAVIDAFLATEMGAECRRVTAAEAQDHAPALRAEAASAALYSPHELRVESAIAIPRLAAWLEQDLGVEFRWSTPVRAIAPPRIETAAGLVEAEAAVVCPGDDFNGLYPERIAEYGLTRCKLQMLRVAPERPTRFGAAVMSDLGLARYLGYAELPEAAALQARLDAEQAGHRANGVHLIVVQSEDGSLVVGDSHHYGLTLDPFSSTDVDELMLSELDAVLDLGARRVTERWIGTYASGGDARWRVTDAPDPAVRLVIVAAGCGASTAFGVGEETIADLFG